MRLSSFSFILVLVLFSSLALATTVTVDKLSYVVDEVVKVSGTCNVFGVSVGLQAGIGLNTVWVEQVTAGADNKFSVSFFPPQAGNYALYASCKGENSAVKTFEVGENVEDMPVLCSESWNCTGWSACSNGIQERNCNDVNECGTESSKPEVQQSCGSAPSGSSGSGSGGGGGGGGGGGCSSNWNCTGWSVCNSSSKQQRTCVDLKKCKQNVTEVQDCTFCAESWVCSQWSECKWNIHERTCTDEHSCGTIKLKPILQKSCEPVAAPVQEPPAYVSPPQQGIIAKLKQAVVGETGSFWGNYKNYIISLSAVLLLAVIVLTVWFLRKPKKVYNLNELKEWVKEEKKMGTSDVDIKTILIQNTGWKEQEIKQVFSG